MIKKIITTFALVSALVLQPASALSPAFGQYKDVSSFATYYEAIEYLTDEGIVNGNPDGNFLPQNTLNRAEMIKIVAEAYRVYNGLAADFADSYANQRCFEDVPANEWFTKYICYAKESGWVVGYEDGRYFKPSQPVAFVEGLKMTMKGLDFDIFETPGDDWYANYVNRASGKNYIPFTITAFYNDLKRDEMTDLITRILKDKEGTLEEYLQLRKYAVVSYETLASETDMASPEIFGNLIKNSAHCVPEGSGYGGVGTLGNYCCGTLTNVPMVDYEYLCADLSSTIFLIALDDNGQNGQPIGCGDSSIPVAIEVPYQMAADLSDKISAALNFLLSLDGPDYGESGLYNALYLSDLAVASVEISEDETEVTVNLTGELIDGGTCDTPRIEAQLMDTIGDFGLFHTINILINGESLDDLLDMQG